MKHADSKLRQLAFLGVRPRLDLLSVLKAAESNDQALNYFIHNYAHYKRGYDEEFKVINDLRFVPAQNAFNEAKKVRPYEVSPTSLVVT